MGVELSMNPSRCDIGVAGGTKKYKLINHCDRMLAYKMRINANLKSYLMSKCASRTTVRENVPKLALDATHTHALVAS
ncbi:hypothetical protein ANCCEY_01647 [Ancylostoma ceylanicum]|uniref:Uncharacterized protein n=1 Tax=Ancylostoma ceylanicum TaxID=53326 RepID=A0A0D6M502_9BILA|nr:hypothetical protein ANCCEY_01647 [Ancylostoma ceylanicum]